MGEILRCCPNRYKNADLLAPIFTSSRGGGGGRSGRRRRVRGRGESSRDDDEPNGTATRRGTGRSAASRREAVRPGQARVWRKSRVECVASAEECRGRARKGLSWSGRECDNENDNSPYYRLILDVLSYITRPTTAYPYIRQREYTLVEICRPYVSVVRLSRVRDVRS